MKKPYGWIQWKGTDVCVDIHCECGCHSHVDAQFFYYFICPKCNGKFEVGNDVQLKRVSKIDSQVSENAIHTGEE